MEAGSSVVGDPDLGTTVGGDPYLGRRQVRLFDFGGDHYELGFQQGLQLREAIHHLFHHLRDFDWVWVRKPPLVPFRMYVSLASRWAEGQLRDDLAKFVPDQLLRLEGIAKGADVPESHLFFALAGEMHINQVSYRLGACTGIVVSEEISNRGEPILVKNLDFPLYLRPYYVTRLSRPKELFPNLVLTLAPWPGCFDGLNSEGLCISYNQAYATDMPKANLPVSVLVQEALERCSTVREAVEFISGKPRGSGAQLLLVDSTGDMAALELSPNFSGVREAEDGWLVATNHYQSREMMSYDLPHTAYYDGRNVEALRGLRVHESSELRLKRAEQLLSEADTVGIKELVNIMSDHGESGRGDDNTICRHGPFYHTTCSLVMLPRSRRLLVAYGHPCESVFTDFRGLLDQGTVEDEPGR